MLGTIWSSCATSYQPRWRYSWSAGPWLLASDEPSVVPFLELFKMPPPRCSPAMAGSKHMGRVQRIWICHLPTSTLLSAGSTMLILLVIAAKDLRRRRMAKCSKRARARSPREKVAVNLTRSKGGNQHRLTRTRRRRRRRRRRRMFHSSNVSSSRSINRLIISNILRNTISIIPLRHQVASRYFDLHPSLRCSHGLCK